MSRSRRLSLLVLADDWWKAECDPGPAGTTHDTCCDVVQAPSRTCQCP